MSKMVCDQINILAQPERVLEAFTNPIDLKNWWGVERSFIELKEGGIYSILWGISESGIKYSSSGIIKSYIPNKILDLEKMIYLNPDRSILAPINMTISVTRNENGTLLKVKQGPFKTDSKDWVWYHDAVMKGWKMALVNLKNYLE